METKKNNSQSEPESPSAAQHRHEAAKDYTRELVEELLSSAHPSVSPDDKKNSKQ
ncbi:MAG: hypothetical protein IKR37_05115 [Paludibacteraceae bacterium]|nr:hypothetical protein [Paludibacteraceae bacterium]